MNSRGLVSGIYRMSLPNSHSKLEEELRLKATLRRLVVTFGSARVMERIRDYEVSSKDDLVRKTKLILTVEAEDRRGGRQSTW